MRGTGDCDTHGDVCTLYLILQCVPSIYSTRIESWLRDTLDLHIFHAVVYRRTPIWCSLSICGASSETNQTNEDTCLFTPSCDHGQGITVQTCRMASSWSPDIIVRRRLLHVSRVSHPSPSLVSYSTMQTSHQHPTSQNQTPKSRRHSFKDARLECLPRTSNFRNKYMRLIQDSVHDAYSESTGGHLKNAESICRLSREHCHIATKRVLGGRQGERD